MPAAAQRCSAGVQRAAGAGLAGLVAAARARVLVLDAEAHARQAVLVAEATGIEVLAVGRAFGARAALGTLGALGHVVSPVDGMELCVVSWVGLLRTSTPVSYTLPKNLSSPQKRGAVNRWFSASYGIIASCRPLF